MDRSVAQGRPADPTADPADRAPGDRPVARWLALAVPIVLVLAALAIYGLTYTDRWYDHFVWQAAAFLEGHAAIRYPVAPGDGLLGNAFFQDVLPVPTADGVPRALLPFPPLPALVLLPFVALWGLATNDQVIFTVLAAIDVAICWWAIGRLPVGPVVRLATTLFFAFGTVFWYTAQLATTWYQAHIVAVGLTFLAIGLAVARRSGGGRRRRWRRSTRPAIRAHRAATSPLRVEPRQFARRLPVRSRLHRPPDGRLRRAVLRLRRRRRRLAAARLVGRSRRGDPDPGRSSLYDLATTGQLVSPAYDYLYRLETAGYPTLGYHADWAAEDPRYLLQNLGLALFGTPGRAAGRAPGHASAFTDRGLHGSGADARPVRPGVPAGRAARHRHERAADQPGVPAGHPGAGLAARSRLVAGALLAVVAIATVDLMHFSQGWVQFGYRFSNDAAPFALVLVALGFQRIAIRRRYGMLLAMTLIVVSLAVNAWGVLWSRILGW